MRFDAHFGEAEAVQLKAAILLYGGAKRIAFASVHEPYRDPEGGAPYLDAGRPITTEFLRTLARGLGIGMAPEILPESVVMRTPEVTAWWVPAAVRPMFFSQTSDGKTLNGRSYPHPPLVFVLDGEHGFSVRALLENRRPGPRSAIAIAPYWNVNESRGSLPRFNGHTALIRVCQPGRVGGELLSKRIHACWKRQDHQPSARATSVSGVTWQGGRCFRRNG